MAARVESFIATVTTPEARILGLAVTVTGGIVGQSLTMIGGGFVLAGASKIGEKVLESRTRRAAKPSSSGDTQ